MNSRKAGSLARVFAPIVFLSAVVPVSYFTNGQPSKGELFHGVHWNSATWLFAGEGNRKRFEQDPAAPAPQFNGYCAYAAARGYKAPADPQTWEIVDGKLYLNFNADAARLWNQDIPGNTRQGEDNWPRLNPF